MSNRLDSAVVRKLIEIGGDKDPLLLLLVTYLGAAFHASLFDGMRKFMSSGPNKFGMLLNDQSNSRTFKAADMRIIQKVSNELVIVYRIAIFDSFLNNLTSYALAARPARAIGNAQMNASLMLAKNRAELVNGYIARRTKVLSRENFGARIRALSEITEVDFQLPPADFDELTRLSSLRNAIVHEGSAYQFTVDENLHVHSQAQAQEIAIGVDDFDVINRIAAILYQQYVRLFLKRELHEIEITALFALNPPPTTDSNTSC